MEIRPQPGPQTAFLSSPADIVIYGGSSGGGKRLSIDTPIATPRGWSSMGDLKIGDQVFAVDGSIANVTTVSPIEIAEDSFAVEFDSGEVIECDGEHLWKTMTDRERVSVLRLSNEFRENRKLIRPSRAKKFKKNIGSSINVTRMNKERTYKYLEPPSGQVRTTYEILETLFVNEKRVNHSVEVCGPLQIPKDDFVYDPYLVGMYLGDGCSTSGTIGCLEEDMNEMLQHVCVKDYSIRFDDRKQKPFVIVRFKNFSRFLRKMNLYKNKHIPISYLRTSIEDRIELLRGLMDTDGTCSANGRCNISLSNKRLIDDVRELISSLGIKSSLSIKKIKGYGDSYCLHFRPQFPVFHLSRKLSRQKLTLDKKIRNTSLRRYIVSVYPIEQKPMRCIAIDHPSHLYLAGKTLIPTHNTFGLLLEAARNINNPDYGGVIFRREQTMITNEGGLRDTALQLYPYLGAEYRSQPHPHFIFPSGAKISFRHLNQESDVLGWQGSQIPFIGYDELSHFSLFQWTYLFSRLRSTSGVRPYIRATTNPDADSWVADMLEWWIDQDSKSPSYGLPIPERSGVIRYFVRINNELMWADSPEELVSRYHCDYLDVKSFTFIPSRITDNPILMKKDPNYLGNLKALTRVERARLLDGNWKVRPQAGDYFPRDAVTIIDWRPTDVVKWIRSWDLAATEESDGRDPDWTVGLLIGRRSNGKIVVAEMIRVRRKAAVIESLVKTTAVRDGKDVWILLPQDPGQSGKSQKESFVGALYDYTVLSRTITKNKVAIASSGANSPASLWQQGQIEIVRGPWNKDFIEEMDAFPTKGVHDDICFIEGTMIATEFGEVCIEDVKPGILVWTRSGWMEVVECQVTSECSEVISIELSNGIILTGTPNHPIICEGDVIVELQNLSSCDKIIHISDTFYGEFLWVLKVEKQIASIIGSAKWLSTMVFDIIVTKTQKIMRTGAILLQEYRQNKTELTCCTDKYGRIILEKLKKDTTSITKMEIQPTTTYQISNVLLQSNIFISIQKGLRMLILQSIWSIFRELEKKRKNGIVAKPEENGTGGTLKILNSTIVKWLVLCVRFAEKLFKQCEKEKETIAQLNVKERTVNKNGVQERNSFIHLTANNAEKSLRATKQHQYFAQSLAQQKQVITFVSKSNQKESKKVYNLRVNGKHEYFANGILVHNCDSFSNGVRQLPGHSKPDYSQSGLSGTYRPLIGKERAKPRRR